MDLTSFNLSQKKKKGGGASKIASSINMQLSINNS